MRNYLVIGLTCALSLGGCNAIGGGKLDLGNAMGAGSDLYNAANVSDKEVNSLALQAATESDSSNTLAPAGNKYAVRLQKLTSNLGKEDGLKLDFKAYLVKDVNAFALSNGSIRVFSGLMDAMTDDELLFILGHEIGHVKLGHSKEKMRMAYIASAARKGAASSNSVAGAVAASEIGGVVEAVVTSQFSQSEETEADDYGVAFMKKHNFKSSAAASALKKLAKASGGEHSFLSSHPEPEGRAKRLEGK